MYIYTGHGDFLTLSQTIDLQAVRERFPKVALLAPKSGTFGR